MKTIAKLVSIIMVLMIALDLPASGLAEERDLNADFETALSGIAYTSVAQVQSNLYFLGTDLYACEVAGGPVVKIDAYFPEELLEAAMSGDLLLVQGGRKGSCARHPSRNVVFLRGKRNCRCCAVYI